MLNVVKQLNINLFWDPSCDQDDNISIDTMLNVMKQLNINIFWDSSCDQDDNISIDVILNVVKQLYSMKPMFKFFLSSELQVRIFV